MRKEKRMAAAFAEFGGEESMGALSLLPQAAEASLSLDLPKGQSFEQWVATGRNLASANRVLNWWIGDWWAAGSHRYGERAKVTAQGIFGREFSTLASMASVCRAFETCRRRQHLSFSHHAEVASLPPAKADGLLDLAEREGLSVMALRAEALLVREGPTARWFDAKPPTRYDRQAAKEAIYGRLAEAAKNGERCPTADELAEVSGVESVATTVALMHVLEQEDRIQVSRFQKSRAVTITATGDRTAEPTNQTPHWRDLEGQAPTTPIHAFASRHPHKAEALFAEAKREGKSPQDFLDECVILGMEVKLAMRNSF